MKILVAMDSYKGSLTSLEAGRAVKTGIERAGGRMEAEVWPVADGGEGTLEALLYGLSGQKLPVTVTGPLGLPVKTFYGMVPDRKLAVIEIASAAGLALVPEEKRNPLFTTTYGVGEMIADALLQGCRHFVIGLGGSATSDGGMGMLQALGIRFLDKNGARLPAPGNGASLHNIEAVDVSEKLRELESCDFNIACDVKNPLYGENGAACVFAPQKGAGKEEVRLLDKGLRAYAEAVCRCTGKDAAFLPGAGAAGGLGYAFFAFLNGKPKKGIDLVLHTLGLEERIAAADFIVTGEGRTDAQTVMGKAPEGIARLAKKYGKKVIVLSGSAGDGAEACNRAGMDAVFSILREPSGVKEAMQKETAVKNLEWTAEQVFRLLK